MVEATPEEGKVDSESIVFSFEKRAENHSSKVSRLEDLFVREAGADVFRRDFKRIGDES